MREREGETERQRSEREDRNRENTISFNQENLMQREDDAPVAAAPADGVQAAEQDPSP